MNSEIFEYRRQARGPRNYALLGLVIILLYSGLTQGWPLVAIALCGPALGLVIVRLAVNSSEGFRMSTAGLAYYDDKVDRVLAWTDLRLVTLHREADATLCQLHFSDGETEMMPATAPFQTDALAREFRLRGVPVWIAPARRRPELAAA